MRGINVYSLDGLKDNQGESFSSVTLENQTGDNPKKRRKQKMGVLIFSGMVLAITVGCLMRSSESEE